MKILIFKNKTFFGQLVCVAETPKKERYFITGKETNYKNLDYRNYNSIGIMCRKNTLKYVPREGMSSEQLKSIPERYFNNEYWL